MVLSHFSTAIRNEQQTLKKKGDACSLCGSQRRLFEPNVLYCNGTCGMQRIRRNASYYSDRTKTNHWCTSCYVQLKDNESIVLDDGNEIKKRDLSRMKNDALPEEAWVQCDDCHSWVHQICALFNGRKNKTAATFTCPKCHIKKRDGGEAEKTTFCAKDLPHCKMSMAIESGLQSALQNAYEDKAKEMDISIDEVEKAEGLTVRVVSNMDKKHVVRDEVSTIHRFCNNDRLLRLQSIFFSVHFNTYLMHFHFVTNFFYYRCTVGILNQDVPRNSQFGLNVLLYFRLSMVLMCFFSECMFTNMANLVQLQIKEECTYLTWIQYNISNPNAIERCHTIPF